MKKVVFSLVTILIVLIAGYLIYPLFNQIELDEDLIINETIVESSEEVSYLYSASFIDKNHGVSGEAFVLEEEKILRFENFNTVNGPNLHIYLATDLEASEYVDLGELKATSGNVNYDLPEGVDLEKYDKVLVWCVPFEVLFGYADLE